MKSHEEFMDEAFSEAFRSVNNNIGGSFGAVVVKEGKVIGKGGNQVVSRNDPTAHAEIVAIREACENLKAFDLSGTTLYATCEPCPMCLSAIYWANIDKVYYSSTRHDAAGIGFRDNHIYGELEQSPENRSLPFHQIDHPHAVELFKAWTKKNDKIPY